MPIVGTIIIGLLLIIWGICLCKKKHLGWGPFLIFCGLIFFFADYDEKKEKVESTYSSSEKVENEEKSETARTKSLNKDKVWTEEEQIAHPIEYCEYCLQEMRKMYDEYQQKIEMLENIKQDISHQLEKYELEMADESNQSRLEKMKKLKERMDQNLRECDVGIQKLMDKMFDLKTEIRSTKFTQRELQISGLTSNKTELSDRMRKITASVHSLEKADDLVSGIVTE